MSKRLILNADDFGLTHGINRAVEELHQAGALTSATLMANGPAFEDAVEIAQRNPGLGIGCHVVLTDGIPVSHPADIPTLLGPDGKTFRSSLVDFLLAVLRGRVSERDIAREAHAQITKLQRAGLDLTHVDTHKHTHTLPGVARPLLFVAERCRIGAIRSPFEQSWSLAVAHADPVRRLQVRLLQHLRKRFEALPQVRQGIVATSDGTLGISATGRLNHETLARLMETMPDGTWELVCHPGYNDRDLDAVTTRLRASREVERNALLATFADEKNPPHAHLIHYGAIGPFARLREVNQFEPNNGHETFV
ncbi:ChbG/HpnK family deacetylase [Granulicella cerasi]|uniref:ChbG/HpnK family deacetylase n=1 Tax=Granulicella cerasi TaxID=741063 RepID=UPI0021E08A88|nr:ChbG/HpnK family deacetylase [Granulicella cerasi]